MSEITVPELDALLKELAVAKIEYEKASAVKAESFKHLEELKMKMLENLKTLKRKNYSSQFGKVVIKGLWEVKTPKSLEDKKALFDWLEQKGIFLECASVNYQTLNALYRAEFDAAMQAGNGVEFKLPGVGEPSMREVLSLGVDREEIGKE